MHVCIIGHVTRRSVRLSVLALLLDGPPTGKEKISDSQTYQYFVECDNRRATLLLQLLILSVRLFHRTTTLVSGCRLVVVDFVTGSSTCFAGCLVSRGTPVMRSASVEQPRSSDSAYLRKATSQLAV